MSLIAKLQLMNIKLLHGNGYSEVFHKDIPSNHGYHLFAPSKGDGLRNCRILTHPDNADLTPCVILQTNHDGNENDLFIRYPVVGEVIDAILFLESLPLPVSAYDKNKEWEA